MILKKFFTFTLAFLIGFVWVAEVSAQEEAGAQGTPTADDSIGSVGLRGGYFFPVGELGDSLSGGFAVGLYFDMNSRYFLGTTEKQPAYIPSLTAQVNFDGLSGTSTSLSRIGFEIGPSWLFSLTQEGNQFIKLGLLAGIASETGKNENVSPVKEKSGIQFNSLLLVNYEFHHLSTGLIYSVGSYNVIGADAKTPLIGVGFHAGVGYKI